MNYKNKFYSKYISSHTDNLYSEPSLAEVKKQFPVWQRYFWKFLPKDKDVNIVDLGCGYGGLIYWLQEIGYSNVEGVDISDEQIENTKRLGIKNINQGDLVDFIKNKKDFYDVVIMRDVLEHFNKEEILDILEFVYKSLKNNGVVIIQTLNAESCFSGRLRYGDFTHELSFTKSSISQVFSISGFKNTMVFPMPPIIHGVKSLIRFVLWRIIEVALRFYLVVETGSSKGIFTQNIITVAKK